MKYAEVYGRVEHSIRREKHVDIIPTDARTEYLAATTLGIIMPAVHTGRALHSDRTTQKTRVW